MLPQRCQNENEVCAVYFKTPEAREKPSKRAEITHVNRTITPFWLVSSLSGLGIAFFETYPNISEIADYKPKARISKVKSQDFESQSGGQIIKF